MSSWSKLFRSAIPVITFLAPLRRAASGRKAVAVTPSNPYGNSSEPGTALMRSVAVGTSSVVLSGFNAHRISLLFNPTNTNRVWISFGQPAVVNVGYALYPGASPLRLDRHNIGASIQQDVFAISEGTGETVPFIEEVG